MAELVFCWIQTLEFLIPLTWCNTLRTLNKGTHGTWQSDKRGHTDWKSAPNIGNKPLQTNSKNINSNNKNDLSYPSEKRRRSHLHITSKVCFCNIKPDPWFYVEDPVQICFLETNFGGLHNESRSPKPWWWRIMSVTMCMAMIEGLKMCFSSKAAQTQVHHIIVQTREQDVSDTHEAKHKGSASSKP